MMFTLEELREYFGGQEWLIGRVKQKGKGFAYLQAIRDTGEPWKYPDGTEVDDILWVSKDDAEYEKGDWVLIRGYEVNDGSDPTHRHCRIRATGGVQLLEEVLKDFIPTVTRDQLSNAIYNVQIVGQRVLAMRSFLDKERRQIHQEILDKKSDLEQREQALAQRREMFEQRERELNQREEKLLYQSSELEQREKALAQRQKMVEQHERELDQREENMRQKHSELEQRERELAQREEDIRQKYSELEQRERELDQRGEEIRQKYSELEQRERELDQREEDIRQKYSELEQREKALAQRQEAVERREEKLHQWEEEVLQMYEEVESQKKSLLRSKTRQPKQTSSVQTCEFASESELLKHIKDFIAGRKFYYEEWTVENFFTCLKTDWLVILAGISGSGKSRLPRLFAEAVGGAFELIPVRPHWNDDRDLLGFFNLRDCRYESTRFLEFLLQANEDPDRLYIICLDEMNLAPVEYYFAQLLSAMETEEPRLNPDETLTEEVISRLQERKNNGWIGDLERYREVPVPPNVRFVGTVNIDHTTHGFSDKVIDRTNIIQFERVDLQAFDKLRKSQPGRVEAKGLAFQQFFCFCELSLSPEQEKQVEDFLSQLRKVDEILGMAGIHLGLRVYQDVERYMGLAIQGDYFPDLRIAFDLQIKQRVLPKIRGVQSDALQRCLGDLARFLREQNFSRSHKKVDDGMLKQLRTKGYVNYWEV